MRRIVMMAAVACVGTAGLIGCAHSAAPAASLPGDLAALDQACDGGNATACGRAGQLRWTDSGPEQQRAREQLQVACDAADAIACEALGLIALGEKKGPASEQLLERACALRSGSSCHALGAIYARWAVDPKAGAVAAKAWWQEGCRLRDQRSCDELRLRGLPLRAMPLPGPAVIANAMDRNPIKSAKPYNTPEH